MKRRSLTLLLLGAGVLLVAAAGVLLTLHPWGAAPAAAETAASPPLTFVQLLQLSPDLLRSIQLIGPTGTIELDSAKGTWEGIPSPRPVPNSPPLASPKRPRTSCSDPPTARE